MTRALRETGLDVEEAANGNAAIEQLHGGQFDVVVCDLKMGGSDGLDVLRTAKALYPTTAVILMTAFGSVQTAVEAMQIGVFDYVQKPFEIEEMELKIEKVIEVRRLKHEIEYLRHTQADIYDFDRIVGASGALQRVLDIVRKVAKTNTTVLIRGETGTGKELIAGALHHNSLRANRNFVRVNCAALQENLLESELFGHEKEAFTGPRWTPQKRPLIDTSKPAISGMAAETGGVLPRGLRGAQVGLDRRAPAAWPALEDMAMMQQAIQQGGDGRGVAESFAPVVNGPV